MNSTNQDQPESEMSLAQKLAQARAEEAKSAQAAANPALSPEAALVARTVARSSAVAARLYKDVQKYHESHDQHQPNPAPPPTELLPALFEASRMPGFSNSLAKQYAEEHHEFLKRSNPRFLKSLIQSGDLETHLHSTGEDAAQMYETIMSQGSQTKEVQEMAYPEKDRSLQNLRQSAQEMVRHDLIYWPLPARDLQGYLD